MTVSVSDFFALQLISIVFTNNHLLFSFFCLIYVNVECYVDISPFAFAVLCQ